MITIALGSVHPPSALKMVNRRQFFSGFWKSTKERPNSRRARAPRYQALETYVVVDLIPYDLVLTSEQDQDLRAQVRALLNDTSDDTLFSMAVVKELEQMVEAFMADMDGVG
jgi:hypothetical protein